MYQFTLNVSPYLLQFPYQFLTFVAHVNVIILYGIQLWLCMNWTMQVSIGLYTVYTLWYCSEANNCPTCCVLLTLWPLHSCRLMGVLTGLTLSKLDYKECCCCSPQIVLSPQLIDHHSYSFPTFELHLNRAVQLSSSLLVAQCTYRAYRGTIDSAHWLCVWTGNRIVAIDSESRNLFSGDTPGEHS